MPVRMLTRLTFKLLSGIDFAKLKTQSIVTELIQMPPCQQVSTKRETKMAPDISDLLTDEDGFYRY